MHCWRSAHSYGDSSSCLFTLTWSSLLSFACWTNDGQTDVWRFLTEAMIRGLKKLTWTKTSLITTCMVTGQFPVIMVSHAIAVKALKTLKLSGIIIIAMSVNDERPRTRTELSTHTDRVSCYANKHWQLLLWFPLFGSTFPKSACPTQALQRLWGLPIHKVFATAKKLGSH